MTSLVVVALSAGLILNPLESVLVTSLGFGLLNAVTVNYMIPRAGPSLRRLGLQGKDMLKRDQPVLAETLGAVCGVIYLFSLIFFIPFLFYKYLVINTVGGGTRVDSQLQENGLETRMFPHSKLSEYLSGLLSLQSMLMLGFADDLFDIRWRHKFFMPAIASIPMLIIYYVDFGVTQVVVPPFLHMFGIHAQSVDLKWVYYLYMTAFAIFSTNCINIYAGVNGLEVGQSVVIALCVLLNDMLYIFGLPPTNLAVSSHLFSAYLLIPFLGGSLALLRANWWPATVFVGDTYCYFSGMVFAVIGILGHFSKTLLSLLAPQIFNFLYSGPQLVGVVPCPRHRMPLLNKTTGLLEPSRADVSQCKPLVKTTLRLLSKLLLLQVWETDDSMHISNMTLINLVLVNLGPLREDRLTTVLLVIQAAWGCTAIAARHMLAALIFGRDNW